MPNSYFQAFTAEFAESAEIDFKNLGLLLCDLCVLCVQK